MQSYVFALKGWTVKCDGQGQWFISPTACFENKHQWSKPYESLRNATTAIARKLEEEAHQRMTRLQKGAAHV